MEKLQKNIYMFYIFLFPMLYMLPVLQPSIITGINSSNSSFVLLIGMMIFFVSTIKKGEITIHPLAIYLFFMVAAMDLSSLFMSMLLYKDFGTLWGENTFRAIIGDCIYYIFVFLTIFYNYQMSKIVTKLDLEKVFKLMYILLLIVGYWQIAVYFRIPGLTQIYDLIAIKTGLLSPSSMLYNVGRITITGTEPGSSSMFYGLLIIPYILAKIIKNERKYIKYLILILPIIYFTQSSTMYIVFVANLVVFAFLGMRDNESIKRYKKLFISFLALALSALLVTFMISGLQNKTNDEESAFMKTINYFLVEKLTDEGNMSTAMRMSTVTNDIKCLYKYPILGIGNGNQGFHFNENIPDWIRYSGSPEVNDALTGKIKVVSGGPFLMAFISGYGILGVILLLIYIIKSNIELKKNKENLGYLYYMYHISIISFLVGSVVGFGLIENQVAIFILSIPLFGNMLKDKQELLPNTEIS
ncbi:MAG: O-antigen ligase family protein [Romboutsia timonensis]|uniref:O-antigen ligase family protein n=1 Tax=Romboutsia timonensis TaxID=1776391 RepID=UPI002A7618D0|nr:O-antigen ligase family protein [Romboutsia timonensis]MDY2884038.1 O-antigen ligase family protein [Romboutsia timonensis]